MSERLFVYGTLMSGEARSVMIGDLPRVPGKVRGVLYHLPAGYPALVPGGSTDVEGEVVFSVSSDLLGLLDLYEGVAEGLYHRQPTEVRVGLELWTAWVYVMIHPERRGARELPPGRWRGQRRGGWTRSTNS